MLGLECYHHSVEGTRANKSWDPFFNIGREGQSDEIIETNTPVVDFPGHAD